MPRESIKMDPDELRAFLASDSRLILATLAEDTKPWGDAVAYLFQNDRVFFRVPQNAPSLQNIRRDNRVACVVESHPVGSEYYAIKGATVHGRAEETGDAAVKAALAAVPDPVEPEASSEGVVFSVGIDDTASFSFAKIKYRYDDQA